MSDRGRQLTSYQYLRFCSDLRIGVHHTTAFHPRSNAVEAYNTTITTTDRMKDWYKCVKEIALAIHSHVNKSTQFTPAQLNFVRKYHSSPKNSIEGILMRDTKILYNVGDSVMLRTHLISNASKGFTACLAPRNERDHTIRTLMKNSIVELNTLTIRQPSISNLYLVCELKLPPSDSFVDSNPENRHDETIAIHSESADKILSTSTFKPYTDLCPVYPITCLKLDSSLGPRPKTIVTISSQLGSRSRSVYVPQNPDPDLDIIESSVTKREPTPTLVPKSKAIIIEELFGFPDEDSCGCPVVGCDGDGEDDNTLRRCEDTPTPSVSVPSTLPANESLPSTTNTCPS
ncbi:unnamed protein product [Allacma fusca]|uniref:Integrase catalytic domain-containing protein n=1 Tax=Allacma fusca TaxID=39272 RepID=A0A8J2KHQ1_9HEXA|nr:unnamed protein product [Allacma fusca]